MKTSLLYGTGITIASALLTFVLYFIGAHNDLAKMQATNTVSSLVGFAIVVVGLVLALRATRTACGDGGMTYGKGVLTSLLVGVVVGVLGAVFNYVYGAIINPGMFDTIHEMQVAALEAKGNLTAEQIDQAAAMMKRFSGPVVTSFAALFGSPVIFTLIGLIVAIFFRRAPVAVPPPPPEATAAS